jgi:hypothetical protein
MLDETGGRKEVGEEMLREHLKKVEGQAELFLAALAGFRRDLMLSITACPKYLTAVFTGPIDMIAVPPFTGPDSYSDLAKMLGFAEDAIDGDIAVKNPPLGPKGADKKNVLKELDHTHDNLTEISETAQRLYAAIQKSCYDFDLFNGSNSQAGYDEANILFDRDALNISMATSRALGERAVRLDIDLVESRARLESGERQAKK